MNVKLAGLTLALAATFTTANAEAPPPRNCSTADIAEPFGVNDLADIMAYIEYFLSGHPFADLNGDSVIDLGDLSIFVTEFQAGCP